MKQKLMSHQIVEFIPEKLDDGVLYISLRYGTAAHKCCCGCGEEVVTPLSPVDWTIRISRGSVTLYPSIGNWNFSCQSHYWIRRGKVIWAAQMSRQEIELGRTKELASKRVYFDEINRKKSAELQPLLEKSESLNRTGFKLHFWKDITDWWDKKKSI